MGWWLLHLFLIFCTFGLGVAAREVSVALKALNDWFVYGSEDPATFAKKIENKPVQSVHRPDSAVNSPGPAMDQPVQQAMADIKLSADPNKLAELKAQLKPK